MSEDHSADRARLLALVPADGSTVGNTALIRQLGWAENRYWYARDSLLEAGFWSARKAAAGLSAGLTRTKAPRRGQSLRRS